MPNNEAKYMKQIGRIAMKNRLILDDSWKFQDSSLNK